MELHFSRPDLRDFESFRDAMHLQDMLLQKIFAGEAPITDILGEAYLNAMDAKVTHIVNNLCAENTFRSQQYVTIQHTYPFDIIVSMYTELVSFPPVKVLEGLIACSTIVHVADIRPIVTTFVG